MTEGNETTWERERYSWDAATETVTATTGLQRRGGKWLGEPATPGGTGTRVEVTATRRGKGVKGRLIGRCFR